MNKLSKKDWLLLLLMQKPLDRIRLMKSLFLIWHRSGRKLQDYYEFTPYMYGPCSFELYHELEYLEKEHLISQAPHPISQWAAYFLTPKGEKEATAVQEKADEQAVDLVQAVAKEVSSLRFHDLLKRVYSEAPDFITRTVMHWRPNK